MKKLSKFAAKITNRSGIGQLMEDLAAALSDRPELLMLGGGNPAHIPKVEQCFRESMQQLLSRMGEFENVVGDYDPPQGNREFIRAVSELLNNKFQWQTKPQNIALTTGSQTAFFILFNIFAGEFVDGSNRKILLPLTPEYIGYCDVGLAEDLFRAHKPRIEHLDNRLFKYHVDFDSLEVTDDIGAICVSRPTNPTGNVLTDDEIHRLSGLAEKHQVPLIIDNAYGTPFPNIIFTEAEPFWNRNTILCLSLSKLGLPATRTGIIIANQETINMVTQANAIMTLAPGSIGAAIVTEMVQSGQIIRISREMIRPFYEDKMHFAVERLHKELEGLNYHIHKPEGAIFVWLWLEDLPVTSLVLYERLKKRGVIVVSGHYFFPGLADDWRHKYECIRINYSRDAETVGRAIKIIGQEIRTAYRDESA
jgi:valine--pyruvate aminotransferase